MKRRSTITIPTHPGRELDEGGVIGEALVYSNVPQSSVNTPQELRHPLPDCLVEVAHSRSHLVLWSRRASPYLIRAKCSLYLHEDAEQDALLVVSMKNLLLYDYGASYLYLSLQCLIKLLLIIRGYILGIQLNQTVSNPRMLLK